MCRRADKERLTRTAAQRPRCGPCRARRRCLAARPRCLCLLLYADAAVTGSLARAAVLFALQTFAGKATRMPVLAAAAQPLANGGVLCADQSVTRARTDDAPAIASIEMDGQRLCFAAPTEAGLGIIAVWHAHAHGRVRALLIPAGSAWRPARACRPLWDGECAPCKSCGVRLTWHAVRSSIAQLLCDAVAAKHRDRLVSHSHPVRACCACLSAPHNAAHRLGGGGGGRCHSLPSRPPSLLLFSLA